MIRPRVLISSFTIGIALAAGAAVLIMHPHIAHAATDFGLSTLDPNSFGLRSDTPAQFVGSIISWVLGVLGILLVALLVYGGVMYMTSAGNEKRVESGKQIITWAIIGLAIILTAFIIARFVVGALTGTSGGIGTGGTIGGSGLSTGGEQTWCTVEDDPRLRELGFYCDYSIGGFEDQGVIRRRTGGVTFTQEEYHFFETNLPSRADALINGGDASGGAAPTGGTLPVGTGTDSGTSSQLASAVRYNDGIFGVCPTFRQKLANRLGTSTDTTAITQAVMKIHDGNSSIGGGSFYGRLTDSTQQFLLGEVCRP